MKSMMNGRIKNAMMLFFVLILTGTSFLFSGCDNKSDMPTSAKITAEDSVMLVQMREEEKLARDVYNTLYVKWNLNVFSNIAGAEQSHMDEVLKLLNEFGLPDPANSEPGKFNNPDLQALYTALVAKGDSSLVNALLVGATIEDLDIYDLEEFTKKTTNADILSGFQFLTCGSRNHMRAFISQLTANDASYTPVYISQTEFDNIINSNREQCGQMP